jgi:hypothetical protein
MIPGSAADKKGAEAVSKGKAVLWRAPNDIRSRDLIYGIGGREGVPRGPFTFVKEDLKGSSPKYTVRDRDGVKWKVKLGQEAKPETAATRIVWAAGYFTSEDYYLPVIQVKGVPAKIHRGQPWVDADGVMRGARLKRQGDDIKKIGTWKWKSNPFIGTREFNGLRTLMGLINNWDVKDVNTAIYKEDGQSVYIVSDLGAAFGAPGFAWPTVYAKSNLEQYRRARFICETDKTKVDFCSPGRTALLRLVDPKEFLSRWRMRWIGHDVPRSDARWMGEILAQLSPAQIRDGFRAGGYAPDEVEGFARVLERRIGELTEL